MDLFSMETPIWIEEEDRIVVNHNNLCLFLKEYIRINRASFKEFEDNSLDKCPDCNSENIKFYQAPINVPNEFSDNTVNKLMWIKLMKCEDCGTVLVNKDLLIAVDDEEI